MIVVAFPLIPPDGRAPPLQGLLVGDEWDGAGDLPQALHFAAEQHERRLLESTEVPSAVWFPIDELDDLHVRASLVPRLAALHLSASGVARVSEGWLFEADDPQPDTTDVYISRFRLDGTGEYGLYAEVDEQSLTHQFARAKRICGRFPQLSVTLEHWLLALDHAGLSEGLLDMGICLESLIRSQNEVGFRFAHQLGRLVAESPADLSKLHSLLKNLYDIRSDWAHGNVRRTDRLAKIIDRQSEMDALMTKCVRYALHFHDNSDSRAEWEEHLEKLLLGTTQRIGQIGEYR